VTGRLAFEPIPEEQAIDLVVVDDLGHLSSLSPECPDLTAQIGVFLNERVDFDFDCFVGRRSALHALQLLLERPQLFLDLCLLFLAPLTERLALAPALLLALRKFCSA
jgi:hypothetical protein